MSQKSERQRSFLETAQKIVHLRWSRPEIAQRFADYEDLQTAKQIDYCLEVAGRWCFLGKDIPPDTRIEIFVANAVAQSEELEQLRKRVVELEKLISKIGSSREKSA
jgi:hypothetical protein